jgi:prepilin-type N-terminal cleavage/methylation domain-containing protein
MNRKGFTLIELVLVITILGILAVAALPRFFDLTGRSRTAARDGVVGAVRAGIAVWRANDMANGGPGTPPTALDGEGANSNCVTCFSSIMTNPVNDTNWVHVDSTHYNYTGAGAVANYVYDTTNGTFQ